MDRREFTKLGLVGIGIGTVAAASSVIAQQLTPNQTGKLQMAEINYPPIGSKVVAKVLSTQGDCTIGMKPGDEFELSTHKCGEFCGNFYKNIHGWVQTLQFGGSVPIGSDPDVQVWDCPNPKNRVQVELRRVKG